MWRSEESQKEHYMQSTWTVVQWQLRSPKWQFSYSQSSENVLFFFFLQYTLIDPQSHFGSLRLLIVLQNRVETEGWHCGGDATSMACGAWCANRSGLLRSIQEWQKCLERCHTTLLAGIFFNHFKFWLFQGAVSELCTSSLYNHTLCMFKCKDAWINQQKLYSHANCKTASRLRMVPKLFSALHWYFP